MLSESERKFMEAGRAAGYSDSELVAKVKERRDAAEPVPPSDQITPEELYAGGSSPESLKAKLEPQSLPDAKPEAGMFKDAIWNSDHPLQKAGENLASGARSVGHMLTEAANTASLGGYKAVRNLVGGAVAPDATQSANQDEAKFAQEHPFLDATGKAAGYMTGGPKLLAEGAGKLVGAAGEAIGPSMDGVLGGAAKGAATAALTNGAISGAEAASATGDPREAGKEAWKGLTDWRAAGLGAAMGGAQAGLTKLAEGADRRITDRNIADFTEGAPASKRDKVVGRAGEKRDRVDMLIRRNAEDFAGTEGDPVKQGPVVQQKMNETGKALDKIYGNVNVSPWAVVDPMWRMAAEMTLGKLHTKADAAVAQEILSEAQHIRDQVDNSRGGMASIPAREVRQYITNLGDNLFNGNDSISPSHATQVRRELYSRLAGALTGVVDHFKPGAAAELHPLNEQMSDLINMNNAVKLRAARAATPSMTLKDQMGGLLDKGMIAVHPMGYLKQKAISTYGPDALRGADNALASAGQPANMAPVNPLLRAAQARDQQQQEQAQALQAHQQAQAEMAQHQQQLEARQRDSMVIDQIFSKPRDESQPNQ